LISRIYLWEGDYDQALQYCKQSLSINGISKHCKINALNTLSSIYRYKGELNRSLKHRQQAIALAEEINFKVLLIQNLFGLGYLYRITGKKNLAIEYLERSLILAEKLGITLSMAKSLSLLTIIYIDDNSREKANRYLSRLFELYNQTRDKGDINMYITYLLAKAYMLKKSIRIRHRVEAQALYKELIDLTIGDPLFSSLSNFCDLLLEELSLNNEPEILDEIIPPLTKSLEMAESAHNYGWLAETKLLQAKLALIQMNTEEAKKLMVQAQRIADLHGLNLLAWGISSEHDKLLEQINIWDKLKKEEAPISERIKLASTNGVLERLQGKSAVEPPELVDEEPILLLIMDNSGTTYFNHLFMANWDYSDLFSSFMSAFNTFMDEIFSKSIDRIKVGENTILVNPVEQFLACYVIKGQSYPALQKLTRFTEAIKKNSEIWQALNKSVKTSEMLELDKPPNLKTVINEIFN
jgi:tetratricopeptide (TPR) repeat protein